MSARVSLAFARVSDMELDNFAQGVINRITGNATYPTPPVTIANLQTAKNEFTMKVAAARAGGPADTAAKNNSRQILIGMLRQIAMYVQMAGNWWRASVGLRTQTCMKGEPKARREIGCQACSREILSTSASRG